MYGGAVKCREKTARRGEQRVCKVDRAGCRKRDGGKVDHARSVIQCGKRSEKTVPAVPSAGANCWVNGCQPLKNGGSAKYTFNSQ